MKFLRHLGAVCGVVAIVVVAGLTWAHFGAQTLAPGPQIHFKQEIVTLQPGRGKPAPGGRPGPGLARVGPNGPRVIRSRPFDLGLGSMFDPVNLPYLRHTVVIETEVIAAVVLIDVLRRRSRRAWRAQQLAADSYRPDSEVN